MSDNEKIFTDVKTAILQISDRHQTIAGIKVKKFSFKQRLFRAMMRGLLGLVLTAATVAIPLLHFFLIPAGLLITFWIFIRTFNLQAIIVGGTATCPSCNERFEMVERKEKYPFKETCPHCSREATVTEGVREKPPGRIEKARIAIETFQPKYTREVGQLISSIQRNEFQIPITLEEQSDLKEIPRFYQRDNGNFWVALDGERVIGTISLLDIGNGNVALRKMFVHGTYRGRDYGTAAKLLDAALVWSKEKNVKNVYLGTTAKFLAAHRFYEKNGFAEIAKEELPASFPVMEVDSKFYTLKL